MDKFFDRASSIIGEDNVSRDPSTGALSGIQGKTSYGDPFPIDLERKPRGAVRPRSVEEVQAIVKVANELRVPLWTVSRGKNLGYGGSCPVVDGSVVLDLHRMNKIVEISAEHAYAIVEPGVSFFDLYEEIQKRKLKLWTSVPAIGWGSVLGNTLDRGFGYTPDGEHTTAQCGMEVVLPTGELLRTGMGAMDNSKLFPLYKGGYGPSVDGLFYQSNFGIVTKLGFHLTPAPEAYCSCQVHAEDEKDLVPLIDLLADLIRRRVIGNSPSVTNIFREALLSRDADVSKELGPYLGVDKCVPDDVLEKIRHRKGWGFWKAHFSLYGPTEVVPALLEALKRAVAAAPGLRLEAKPVVTAPSGKFLESMDVGEEEIPHAGVPTLEPLGLTESRAPGAGHMDYSPILPPSGQEIYSWYLTAKQRTIDAKVDLFADFHVYARYVIAIELVVFAQSERERMKQLYLQLLADGAAQGYSVYRTHVSFMDDVREHFSFNGGAFGQFAVRLKNVLDPNGILSPGKSGVWNSEGKGGA
ncbi:Vanillyl-alcohol oxidase [Zalerion maritima]|uniref:Vanillyl-alcohol oxidase n=1 Tax=Zalerion maritima TaxID=339359 RepID=A0AAD5RLE2_9PEZI|nr:Vanillyl-alcohol oxidase [Zalerion maritima]